MDEFRQVTTEGRGVKLAVWVLWRLAVFSAPQELRLLIVSGSQNNLWCRIKTVLPDFPARGEVFCFSLKWAAGRTLIALAVNSCPQTRDICWEMLTVQVLWKGTLSFCRRELKNNELIQRTSQHLQRGQSNNEPWWISHTVDVCDICATRSLYSAGQWRSLITAAEKTFTPSVQCSGFIRHNFFSIKVLRF